VDPLRVAELERRLGYRFRDPRLLEQALTHASYANEHPPAADHSRLAFLGDAALALVVAERLMAGGRVSRSWPRRSRRFWARSMPRADSTRSATRSAV
jgi:dsRNA-specific ribonuclease